MKKTAQQHGVQIVKHSDLMPLWYVMSMRGSDFDNAIDASNYFYETGLFGNVDPAFMFDFTPSFVPNDPYFVSNDLWGLNNVAHPDYDIDAVGAWDISKGEGVVVAVVDQGIDPNHNDLSPNFHTLSYDAQSGTAPSVFTGKNHGTHVAGTVAAVGNNSLQVVGVAHKAKIMRISHDLGDSSTISYELSIGITWAWLNGADVITNSWGDHNGQYPNLHSAMLEQAIVSAMETGRNGKGCVVLFAAGNDWNYDTMGYPGDSHYDILTVGSIDNTGERSYFSSYGTKLDVVAPGNNILSTLNNNSVGYMSGTSMATPHVAGIAALILSKYPDFTRQQVVDIIESTAQKIRTDLYSYTSSRPNGTWNNQMGYGLVNALSAISKTIVMFHVPALTANKSSANVNGEPVMFTVNNPIPDAQYEWEVDGTINTSVFHSAVYINSANGEIDWWPVLLFRAPLVSSSANPTILGHLYVRCRAMLNGQKSEWSNMIAVPKIDGYGTVIY